MGLARHDGTIQRVHISELLATEGLERVSTDSAAPGDIVAVAGIEDIMIGESLVDLEDPRPLPLITVDDPAISMTIGINTSPMAGRVKGAKVTARQVKDRLDRELIGNVRASDAGAPHQRARLFVIGYPDGQPWHMRRPTTPQQTPSRRPQREPTGPGDSALMPTPTASDHKAGRHQDGTGHSLTQAVQILPTTYGPYAPAIARWEHVTGRQAPPPTNPPRREGGKPQLSARFVEWLMGLPDGHVTDLDLSRERQLRLLGNGVVPQQAALAVHTLINTAKDVENGNV